MESILLIKDILIPNSFLTKTDLKDAFYSIPIARKSRKYLIYLQQQALSIFRPTIRNFNSSSSVFQDSKACYCCSPHKRHISHHLSSRSTHCCRNVYRLSEPYETSKISLLESLGFRINYEKSGIIPTQKLEYLGFTIDTTSVTLAEPPRRKNSVDTIISPKASSNKRYHLSKTAFKIHRPLHFSKTCCLPSTSALSITSVSMKLCFKGSPILLQSVQSEASSEPRSPNRPKVVGKPPAVSQQNTNSYKRARSHHHIGCLRSGLGIMVLGKIGSRPMVSGGNVLAYKPKGTSSCKFGSKIILPISNKSVASHSTSNRQSGSRFIYKPSGRKTLETSLPNKSGSAELVPIKTNPYLRKADRSLLLPNSETTLLPPSNQKALKPQLNINKLTLAFWPLSGNAFLNTKFLRGRPKSYSPHGAQEQNLSINPVGESGMAGVWNGKSIRFLVT